MGILFPAQRYLIQVSSFEDEWRPVISSISWPEEAGDPISLAGTGFRGFNNSEASGGHAYSSATNYPLVQLRDLG